MEIKDITTKNLMNKYNNFQLIDQEDEEFMIYTTIYKAS